MGYSTTLSAVLLIATAATPALRAATCAAAVLQGIGQLVDHDIKPALRSLKLPEGASPERFIQAVQAIPFSPKDDGMKTGVLDFLRGDEDSLMREARVADLEAALNDLNRLIARYSREAREMGFFPHVNVHRVDESVELRSIVNPEVRDIARAHIPLAENGRLPQTTRLLFANLLEPFGFQVPSAEKFNKISFERQALALLMIRINRFGSQTYGISSKRCSKPWKRDCRKTSSIRATTTTFSTPSCSPVSTTGGC